MRKTNSNFRVDKKLIELLPQHLKVNYLITDEDGLEIDSSRTLSLLQKKNKERVVEVIEEVKFEIEVENLTYWPNFDIPETVEANWNDEKIMGFPAAKVSKNLLAEFFSISGMFRKHQIVAENPILR